MPDSQHRAINEAASGHSGERVTIRISPPAASCQRHKASQSGERYAAADVPRAVRPPVTGTGLPDECRLCPRPHPRLPEQLLQ